MNTNVNNEKILDSIAMGIFTIDMDWNITYFNSEAEKMTGFVKKEAMGRKCYEVFRSKLCFKGNVKFFKGRNQILNKHNEELPVDITATALTDDAGAIIGGVELFIDDTTRVELEKKIEQSYTFCDIIGRDQKIVNLFDIVSIVAPTGANVLILGETGSGKDLFARAIHNSSQRKNGPFVTVNCPALPDTLLESELFGYMRGAFTDAQHTKQGRFQVANKGTIPSLRERPEDISLLIDYLLTRQAKAMGKKPFRLSPGTMKILLNYEYPGNVRELRHIIEHTTILCRKSEISIDDLPEYLVHRRLRERLIRDPADLDSVQTYVSGREKQIILEALVAHGRHRDRAAKALNIDRTTLWRKIKRYELLPPH